MARTAPSCVRNGLFGLGFLVAALQSIAAPAASAALDAEPEVTGSIARPSLFGTLAGGTVVVEATVGETTLKASLGHGTCLFLRLPGTWQALSGSEGFRVGHVASQAQVSFSFHAAPDLALATKGTLASSYAAQLEHEYEELIGRPVTVATVESISSGVYRWRGTWSDGNFDNESRELNLERLLVEAQPEGLIALSVQGYPHEAYNSTPLNRLLSSLELRKPNCRL